MGKMTRSEMERAFWNNVEASIDGQARAIQQLLEILTDKQLEELVLQIKAGA